MEETDLTLWQFVFDKKYKIQLYKDPQGVKQRELRIFTDGSKTMSGTGSGSRGIASQAGTTQPMHW